VYHPSANDGDVSEILAPLADRFGLIKTGGSDFHGFFRSKPCPLATRITYEDDIDALYALKNATAKKRV
jgi:hypothetical protein